MFDEATIIFDYFSSSLTVKSPDEINEKTNLSKFERNDMFLSQTKYFISRLKDFSSQDSIQNINESQKIINICNYDG